MVALKHGGRTVAGNLALCCEVCDRFKGSDIASLDPETGQLMPLFRPCVDRWEDHYHLRGGKILALTAIGRVTVRLLRMNRPARIRERGALQGRSLTGVRATGFPSEASEGILLSPRIASAKRDTRQSHLPVQASARLYTPAAGHSPALKILDGWPLSDTRVRPSA